MQQISAKTRSLWRAAADWARGDCRLLALLQLVV